MSCWRPTTTTHQFQHVHTHMLLFSLARLFVCSFVFRLRLKQILGKMNTISIRSLGMQNTHTYTEPTLNSYNFDPVRTLRYIIMKIGICRIGNAEFDRIVADDSLHFHKQPLLTKLGIKCALKNSIKSHTNVVRFCWSRKRSERNWLALTLEKHSKFKITIINKLSAEEGRPKRSSLHRNITDDQSTTFGNRMFVVWQ